MKTILFKLAATSALAYGLAACNSKEKTAETGAATTPTEAPTAPPAAASANPPAPAATETAAPAAEAAPSSGEAATFDINSVPVSSANMGKFPYIGGLKGYHVQYASDSVDYEFDRSYLYDGKNLVAVEGHVLRRRYTPIDEKKQASDLMVRRNYENWVQSMGGVKVFSGLISKEAIEKIGGEKSREGGLSYYTSKEYDVYLIRQKDKEVWVQVQKPDKDYYLNVVEKAAMPQQVSVVKADELKKN